MSTTSTLSMTFSNYLLTDEWDLDASGYTDSKAFSGLDESPSSVMKPNTTEQMAVTANLGATLHGPLEIWCIWRNKNWNWRFGLKLTATSQALGIGPRATWEVMSDNDTGKDYKWKKSGSDPSHPVDWTFKDKTTITLTPTSEHTTLSVEAIINHPSPPPSDAKETTK